MQNAPRRLPDSLYRWYAENKRQLPFRDTGNFYHTWVSEIMLQQTRVAAMIPAYLRFTERFPDLSTLADASEEEVLSYWKGLGYYSRARNLHKGAKYVIGTLRGRFPSTPAEAKKIPGIGDYTAGAILSIAFGCEVILLDGNVKRFFSRFYYPESGDQTFRSTAEEIMKGRNRDVSPGDHNQALMEIGALICTPSSPVCGSCPVREDCKAWNHGGVDFAATLPKIIKKEKKDVDLTVYLISKEDNFLVIKDSASGFFKKDWFFPHVISEAGTALHSSSILGELTCQAAHSAEKFTFRHTITHHRIRVIPEFLKADSDISETESVRWVKKDKITDVVISSLAEKILNPLARMILRKPACK